jgi:hypothetical protein
LGDEENKYSWKHHSILRKYIPCEESIEFANYFLVHSNNQFAGKLANDNHSKTFFFIELKQKYAMSSTYAEYGGHPLLSRVSHVHLNQNVHANYVKIFEARAAKNGETWKPALRRKEKNASKKEKKALEKKAK